MLLVIKWIYYKHMFVNPLNLFMYTNEPRSPMLIIGWKILISMDYDDL